ncbi:MAG: nucleotide exchange factor GrpE [Gemmatimonadota bacterium]|nr:nucleotide exchange factor GrpE [Gemmatimonadota bacterium]
MKNSKKKELHHDSEDFLEEHGADPAADGDPSPPSAMENATPADDGADPVQAEREKYLRLAAEYDNFRKRSAKERLESGGRAQAELVRRLVEGLDDLARFAHVDPATTDAVTIVQGVEMVEKKILRELGALGLEVVNPVDQPFDPALHEAVATEPTPAKEDDHMVARVYQPGYVFQNQLIRPARVVVKQWNG